MPQPLRILHLDDSPADADLVRRALTGGGIECSIDAVSEPLGYTAALAENRYDLILCDGAMPGYHGDAAMLVARDACPDVPFIVVSGHVADPSPAAHELDHAMARIPKSELERLAPAVRNALARRAIVQAASVAYVEGMRYLVQVVQHLSLARTLQEVMAVTRVAARRLARADGATFVLRDGERCFYADEDAIGPLWKGLRFPMSACISGWAMLNRQAAVIPDIYQDERIPHGAYRPTFVKSLVMTPIRTGAPVGAIGVYWARPYRASTRKPSCCARSPIARPSPSSPSNCWLPWNNA
jgi:CheY-like chemotaxis protein